MRTKSELQHLCGWFLLCLVVMSGSTACLETRDSSPAAVAVTASNVHTVCADGPTVPGIDVSYYQEEVDWARVRGAGYVFAYARVSDGTGTLDSQFRANWLGIRNAGLIRGAYQFFRPRQDPTAQADLFLRVIDEAGGMGREICRPWWTWRPPTASTRRPSFATYRSGSTTSRVLRAWSR